MPLRITISLGGELAYEIDTEIVDMLYKAAKGAGDEITWSKTLPVGVN